MIPQNLFKMSGSLAFLLHHRKNEDFPEIPIIIIKSPPCPPWTTTDYSDRQRYRWILHPYRSPCRLLRHYIPEVKLMLLEASIMIMNQRFLLLNFSNAGPKPPNFRERKLVHLSGYFEFKHHIGGGQLPKNMHEIL